MGVEMGSVEFCYMAVYVGDVCERASGVKKLLCGDSVRVYLEVLIPVHLCVFSLSRRFKHMCRCNNNDLRYVK